MKPANLLRWYPRAWRERYGEELLILVQDNLDEGRPAWPLRLSVIWGGLGERGRQARHAAAAWFKRPVWSDRWGTILMAGLVAAFLPRSLAPLPPAARAWQAVALDALLAAVALTGAAVLADGLAALPALVRFLRAGGWPRIRRRVARAAGATEVAGGGLVGLIVVPGSSSSAQLNLSWAWVAGLLVTGLAMAVVIGLWAIAATATARHLTLAPRVRAAQLVLGAVIPAAVTAVVVTQAIWWSATQASVTLLVLAVINLALASLLTPGRIGRAVRRGRRLRSAASGATIINPSAHKAHGRHRA
jgi:hypothetical protein